MEAIVNIVRQETEKHADDIDAAVSAAVKRVKRLKEYAEFVDGLVVEAIRNRIHDVRHTVNVQVRHENNGYGAAAKVTAGEVVQRVALSVYAYMIAGKTLGAICGNELCDIASDEEARADGHMFNAKLARKLKSLVSDEKTVRQCVSESKLKKIFTELS